MSRWFAPVGLEVVPVPASTVQTVARPREQRIASAVPRDPNVLWRQLYQAFQRHEETWSRFARRLVAPGELRLMRRFLGRFWDPVYTERVNLGDRLYGSPQSQLETVRRLGRALVAARTEAERINLPLPELTPADTPWYSLAHEPIR